jgi:hypothetical protein
MKFIAIILSLIAAIGATAQVPPAGAVQLSVKNAGAGSSIQWTNAATPPAVFGVDVGGVMKQFSLGPGISVVDGQLRFASTGGTWGTITGTITAQTDLQTALNARQPLATVLTNTTASFTTALETKLNGIAAGAEVNVNADWNATSGDAQILNKPTLGTMAAETATNYLTVAAAASTYLADGGTLTTGLTFPTGGLKVNDGTASTAIDVDFNGTVGNISFLWHEAGDVASIRFTDPNAILTVPASATVSGTNTGDITITDTDTIDHTLTGQSLTSAARLQMSVTSDASGIRLVGDAATPGNNKVYGTNASGNKGWYDAGSGSIGGSTGSTNNAILVADGAGGSTLKNTLTTILSNGSVLVPSNAGFVVNNTTAGASDFSASSLRLNQVQWTWNDGGNVPRLGILSPPTTFPTSDLTWTLPATTGTIALLSNIPAAVTPAGTGSELQFRSSGSALGAVTRSSVSGAAMTLGDAESMGVTSTPLMTLRNTTAAAAGAQQVSPSLVLEGRGWRTNATAQSQTVRFRQNVLPVQGAASPTATWRLQSEINGDGTWGDRLLVPSTGPSVVRGGLNIVHFGSSLQILDDDGVTVRAKCDIGRWFGRDFSTNTNTESLGRDAIGGVGLGMGVPIAWSSASQWWGGTYDVQLQRGAEGVLQLLGSGTNGGSLELREQTAPAAPAADRARIWIEDNGSGKTRLMIRFATGAAQQIAIEP